MDLFNHLTHRECPICHSTDDHHIFFEENVDASKLDQLAFASRKIPEFMNLRMVRCPTCELVYAPSLPPKESLNKAYHSSAYDSDEEARFAAQSYGKWLPSILAELPEKKSALDVGTGNGAFLTELLKAGFETVTGIEPSIVAIAAAPEDLKAFIKEGMFQADDFAPQQFDLITIFQTLEHIDQPLQFFKDAYHLLKPGGALMMVTHNYRHWLLRLLGKKAPIVDIEHLQLFSPNALRYGLDAAGFKNIHLHPLKNTYPFHYWFKLLPIPRAAKQPILKTLKEGNLQSLGHLPLSLSAGNLVTWAFK